MNFASFEHLTELSVPAVLIIHFKARGRGEERVISKQRNEHLVCISVVKAHHLHQLRCLVN